MRLVSLIAYAISFLFVYLSIYIAEGSRFSPMILWDFSSALIILAGICATLINFKFSEIVNAFSDSLSGKRKELAKDRHEMGNLVIKTMSNYVFMLSVASFIMSMIFSLGNMESVKSLGNSIAISFIVLIYGVFFKYIVFSPLLISLNNKKAI